MGSFWVGGFEGADHLNESGRALDMARDTGHLAVLDGDYRRAVQHGFGAVRESIGWRLAEPETGRYDLQRALTVAEAANRHRLQVLWTFMHYGLPPDLSLFDDRLIERFAAFAHAVARALAPWHERPPVYTLINEIGYVAWMASNSSAGGGSEVSGYEVKRRLVRAVLAGIEAVRAADPRARFLHVEPLVHVVAPRARPDLAARAAEIASYQWQAWDLIAGRLEPELGGSAEALDLVGVNHYHSGQWEAQTEKRLAWHLRDPRRRPFSKLLADAWQRYRRPLIVSETSHFGEGRAEWLNDIAAEVREARERGVPVEALTLYPLIDRFDWNDTGHWHRSGLWDQPGADASEVDPARPPTGRVLCRDYAAALARWQQRLPLPSPSPGTPMPYLIVFSHLRWRFVWQRPQHLMSRLAQHYRVLFIEEPLKGEGPARLERLPQGPDLDVLVPHTPVEAPGFHDDQLPLLKPLFDEYLREHAIDDYIVWLYTPMALPLLATMRPRAVVYDCMDELSAFKDAPRQLRQRERALLKAADLVLTGGPSLYEARRDEHPNVHCLPSSVDAAHFACEGAAGAEAEAAAALQAPIGTPRLGFFGVVDERFDAALLGAVAEARPQWQFVIVGPVVKIDPAALPQRPNIHWLGMQPYARLPHLMAGWQVCLMPFALNEATRFISPTKTLEYLAGGKPVVSTPVADVATLYGDAVVIAEGPEAFVAACEAALAETPAARSGRLQRGARAVQRSSWEQSAERVHALLQQELQRSAPKPPKTSPAAAPAALAATGQRPVREVRHLVIGAGPTGLAAALHLGEDAPRADTLVVEREDRVGGWCRSVEANGYTFDHAGHIMFSNDEYVLDLYRRLLGDNVHWQDREAWVYSKNVYTRYPFQGALHGLPPKVLKECLLGAIEARFGPIAGGAPARPAAPPQNFEEFIERVWGRGIAEHFATPYNRKLWAVPLAEMETSWLGGRVPLPDLAQMIEGALEPVPKPMGPNAHFGYPLRGGFQALMDGFLPLLNCDLELGTSVLHVSPSQRTVRLDDGRMIGFDTLVSTMPLPRFVEACGDEAPQAVREAARGLRSVAVRCVNLGIRLAPGEERLTDKHWIYYPEDAVFHRIFVQGNASPHCSPPGGCGITCEITYGPGKPLPCDGAALVERVIADCRRVGFIGEAHTVEVAHQADMPGAYVIYDHARAANVACIRDWLAGFGVVLAGRYAEWEYYNSDHAFLAGRKAAQRVREQAASTARSAKRAV